MLDLDPRSMIALAGVMSGVMALVLLFMRRYYPPYIRGLGGWALAPTLWLVATVLLNLREAVPHWMSVILANNLLIVGTIVYYMGTRDFLGRPGSWRGWTALLAVTTVVFVLLTYVWYSFALRVAFFTAVMFAVNALQLRFLLKHGGPNFPVRMVEVVLGLHMAVLATRLASVVAGYAGTALTEVSAIQTIYIGAYALTVLMLTIGAVLMATDRLRTELERLATYDTMTGTYNRRALLQRCDEEIERARRHGQGLAIMMIDLDHFKQVNDTHGHQHGDAVLVRFAEQTRAVLRSGDRLGRYGGEEFMLLLPATDVAAAQPVAERIHAVLATGHALDCQVSIGLTGWKGPEDTLDAMLSRADAALYRAKAQGRNRTCVG